MCKKRHSFVHIRILGCAFQPSRRFVQRQNRCAQQMHCMEMQPQQTNSYSFLSSPDFVYWESVKLETD
jgi:hypothetical protein